MARKKEESTPSSQTSSKGRRQASSGGGPTIERHGMNRALDSTPTAQMRQELGLHAEGALREYAHAHRHQAAAPKAGVSLECGKCFRGCVGERLSEG